MSTLREVFGFFSRGERVVLQEVLNNLDVSIEAAEHLQTQVGFLQKCDYVNIDAEFKIISDLEEKEDDLHRSLVREIASESFFGGIREDFIDLLEKIDSIADQAKDAAKIVHLRHIPKGTVDYLFQGDVQGFIAKCVETTELLRDCIVDLEKSREHVLGLTEKVERSEEEGDAIRYGILENFLKNEIDGNVLDIILLKDFLNAADDVADYAEYASDVLQMLVVKGYS